MDDEGCSLVGIAGGRGDGGGLTFEFRYRFRLVQVQVQVCVQQAAGVAVGR